MNIILQIILGLLIVLLICILFYGIEYNLFFIFNREAYKEYSKVNDDIKNNRIPNNNVDFIEYNQRLKYISIRSTFSSIFIDDKNKICSEYYVVSPYSSFCEERSKCDFFDKIFKCNVFNWRK